MREHIENEHITVVDAPEISLTEKDKAGDGLLNFYKALGWNGEDILDPRKVCTTKEVYYRIYDVIYEKTADCLGVGMLMVNSGPSVDSDIPPNKVYLFEGWTIPTESKS